MQALDRLRLEQQIGEGEIEQRSDFGTSPVGMGGALISTHLQVLLLLGLPMVPSDAESQNF